MPVVVFFSWWSWWTVAGLVLAVAGALWLAFGEVGTDVLVEGRDSDDRLGGAGR